MPSLSPTMETGNLVEWNKKEGDFIDVGDVICSIETDKATLDFEAQEEGYLAKIILPDGSSDIQVGSLIGVVVDEEDEVSQVDMSEFADTPAPTPAAAPAAPAAPAATPEPVAATSESVDHHAHGGEQLSPSVLRLERDYKTNFSMVTPTGPKGNILKGDVLGYIKEKGLKPIKGWPSEPAHPIKPTEKAEPKIVHSAGANDPFTQSWIDTSVTEDLLAATNEMSTSKRYIAHTYLTSHASATAFVDLAGEHQSALFSKIVNTALRRSGLNEVIPEVGSDFNEAPMVVLETSSPTTELLRNAKMVLTHTPAHDHITLKGAEFGSTINEDFGDELPHSGVTSPDQLETVQRKSFTLSFDTATVDPSEAGEFMAQVQRMVEDPELALL